MGNLMHIGSDHSSCDLECLCRGGGACMKTREKTIERDKKINEGNLEMSKGTFPIMMSVVG
jgi:hypothetical protein